MTRIRNDSLRINQVALLRVVRFSQRCRWTFHFSGIWHWISAKWVRKLRIKGFPSSSSLEKS